jgi:hypothetical protein
LTSYNNEYFFEIYLDRELVDSDVLAENFTNAFCNLYKLACAVEGIHYLKIDRDGPVIEQLKQFDW